MHRADVGGRDRRLSACTASNFIPHFGHVPSRASESRDVGVHRAGVADRLASSSPYRSGIGGHEGEDLVRRPLDVVLDRPMLGGEFRIDAQGLERHRGRRGRVPAIVNPPRS